MPVVNLPLVSDVLQFIRLRCLCEPQHLLNLQHAVPRPHPILLFSCEPQHLLSSQHSPTPSFHCTSGLRAAMGMLSEGNITRVINTLRDPDNRNYMVAVGMIAAAALCAFGYRCIRICKPQHSKAHKRPTRSSPLDRAVSWRICGAWRCILRLFAQYPADDDMLWGRHRAKCVIGMRRRTASPHTPSHARFQIKRLYR